MSYPYLLLLFYSFLKRRSWIWVGSLLQYPKFNPPYKLECENSQVFHPLHTNHLLFKSSSSLPLEGNWPQKVEIHSTYEGHNQVFSFMEYVYILEKIQICLWTCSTFIATQNQVPKYSRHPYCRRSNIFKVWARRHRMRNFSQCFFQRRSFRSVYLLWEE